jgi:hypothetical protein
MKTKLANRENAFWWINKLNSSEIKKTNINSFIGNASNANKITKSKKLKALVFIEISPTSALTTGNVRLLSISIVNWNKQNIIIQILIH